MNSIQKYIQMQNDRSNDSDNLEKDIQLYMDSERSPERLNYRGLDAGSNDNISQSHQENVAKESDSRYFETDENRNSDDGNPETPDALNLTEKVRHPQDSVLRKLQFPLNRKWERGMISPEKPKSQIAEEFRSIKRPILANINSKSNVNSLANVIMVTSCVEGEGKTFSAVNLAMSLAMERDRTVLLIDADVMKATTSALVGFAAGEPGLTDVLMDESCAVNDVIWRTNIDKLRCVPAGVKSDHASELLGSTAMIRLITQLSNRYSDRVILLDAPPVLVTSEAMVLANLVGQIVFVVSAESTTQGMVADALGRLPATAQTGLILNKSRKKLGTSYGYGYGYGQDYTGRVREGETGAA